MSRSARTVAPLVGLKYCDLTKGEVEIDTDLYFEAAPQIKLNNHKREQIGGTHDLSRPLRSYPTRTRSRPGGVRVFGVRSSTRRWCRTSDQVRIAVTVR